MGGPRLDRRERRPDTDQDAKWFNERFEEVSKVGEQGRYYVYGEAPGPGGSVLRRALTCVFVAAEDPPALAETVSLPPRGRCQTPVRGRC